MMDATAASRNTVVESIWVHHTKRGEAFHPNLEGLGMDAADEIWTVWIATRAGLLPPANHSVICYTQEAADEYVARHPVGSQIPDGQQRFLALTEDLRNYFEKVIDEWPSGPGPFSAGDGDLFLPMEVLEKAGIRNGIEEPQKVTDFLGKKRVDMLKNTHGDNWCAAAVFEYCLFNLPHTSPAYIAAACEYHYYITGDEFSAGYLLRDLECLSMGVESEAAKAISMRKKAGAEGSKKSTQARERRRANLMDNMEAVAARNPDLSKLGPDVIAALALEICCEADPNLWSQGGGQIDEYLGEIRRGEAGPEMQDRFRAIFPMKPPKRFQA